MSAALVDLQPKWWQGLGFWNGGRFYRGVSAPLIGRRLSDSGLAPRAYRLALQKVGAALYASSAQLSTWV
jgi:hypothetical protein